MSTEHKCSCVGEKPINCNGNGECDNSDVVNTSTEVVVKTTPKSVSFVDAHEADSVLECALEANTTLTTWKRMVGAGSSAWPEDF